MPRPNAQARLNEDAACDILRAASGADVAQLAEQLICNQQVIGSTPIIGSTAAVERRGRIAL